LNHQQKDTM